MRSSKSINSFDVVFIHSSDPRFEDVQMYGFHFMPVWAYAIGGIIDGSTTLSHLKYELFDQRFEDIKRIPTSQIYLFSGINQDVDAILDNLETIKKIRPDSLCILGGPIVDSYLQMGELDKLSQFDGIYCGRADEDFEEYLFGGMSNGTVPRFFKSTSSSSLSYQMSLRFIEQYQKRYYGGIIEVGKGCPFHCSFCDIVHREDCMGTSYRSYEEVVYELDKMAKVGVKQVLLACDNFIGRPNEAARILHAIIDWRKRANTQLSLYTWCTLNIYRDPELMSLMRRAGLDFLFIGIESFDRNSLSEASKNQNLIPSIAEATRLIQSYGLVIVAGLIVGFDNDPDNVFDLVLDSIVECGIISGDLSPLIALPGTPLFDRLSSESRILPRKFALGHYKFETNIIYNHPRNWLVNGFKSYHKNFSTGKFQYLRFKQFIELIQGENFIDSKTCGYSDLTKLFKMACMEWRNFRSFLMRPLWILSSGERFYYFMKSFMLFFKSNVPWRRFRFYFSFWFYIWTNSYLKYGRLEEAQYDFVSRCFQEHSSSGGSSDTL